MKQRYRRLKNQLEVNNANKEDDKILNSIEGVKLSMETWDKLEKLAKEEFEELEKLNKNVKFKNRQFGNFFIRYNNLVLVFTLKNSSNTAVDDKISVSIYEYFNYDTDHIEISKMEYLFTIKNAKPYYKLDTYDVRLLSIEDVIEKHFNLYIDKLLPINKSL